MLKIIKCLPKWMVVVFVIVLSLQAHGQSAKQFYYQEPIETQLSDIYSEEYELYHAIEVDSVAGTNKASPLVIEDPYQTLQEAILFAARNKEADWRVGIYRRGNIVWMADQLFECSNVYFYGALDLNLDGEVDIAVNCEVWTNTVFIGWLWIYSWNGSSGNRINAIKDNGLSQLQSSHSASFDFLDLDGDGIMEIRARGIGEKVNERVYWSWNGTAYGDWVTTPTPPAIGFYPADMAKANLNAKIVNKDTSYVYEYILSNDKSSKRRITEFYVEHGKYENIGDAPEGWRFFGGKEKYLLDWIFVGENTRYMIDKNKSKSGFSVSSNGLPVIYNFYVRSEHELPDYNSSYTYEKDLNDIRSNSFKGVTIAPGPDPKNYTELELVDSLHSYTTRACQLEWITNKGICRSLQAPLQNTKRQLERGNTRAAANTVQAFLNEVRAVRRNHLTSEGYGLLWFNGQYLLERLTN